jgi:hypothetical protein
MAIAVCHYPPGTSKWNQIEHRLFSFISFFSSMVAIGSKPPYVVRFLPWKLYGVQAPIS